MYRVAVPRPTLKTVFVAAATLVAMTQLVAVTFTALPPNRYSDAVTPHTGYLNPMFTQNWRLFAPNPVSDDRNLRFQGAYRAADGTIQETAWVDWTEVELDLVHHRLIGGRAGYITNKLFSPLGGGYRSLLPVQREVADRQDEANPPSWAKLGDVLLAAGPDKPLSVAQFIRYEQATARLATEVLMARWPDRTFTAVRYSLTRQGVVPFSARNLDEKQREAARPLESVTTGGWRVPTVGSAAERHSIADFDRRHR